MRAAHQDPTCPRSPLWPCLHTQFIPHHTPASLDCFSPLLSSCFFPTLKCTPSVGNAAIPSLCLGVSDRPPPPHLPSGLSSTNCFTAKPSLISLPGQMFLLEPQTEPWTTPHGIVTLQFTSEGLLLSLIFASPGAPKGRDSVSFY